jgi:hypothetical protein
VPLTPFLIMRFYLLGIDNWCEFYDLNIPDSSWISLGQNQDLDTLIEITDPLWSAALEYINLDFLIPIWIQLHDQ